MESIIDRKVVVRRIGETYQMLTDKYLPKRQVHADFYVPEIALYIIKEFIIEEELLVLQYDGDANAFHFRESAIRNQDWLERLEPKRLFLSSKRIPDPRNRIITSDQRDSGELTILNAPEFEQKKRTFLEELKISDFIFAFHAIGFYIKIPETRKAEYFEVKNAFILPEFEPVKKYFLKFLPKKVVVEITLIIQEGKLTGKSAECGAFEAINNESIDRIYDLIIEKKIKELPPVEIIPVELVAGGLPGDKPINLFLQQLLQAGKTKHFFHLQYLSELHDTGIMKLSVTGKPLSFVFALPVKDEIAVIWETYATDEATYIWKISKREKIPDVFALISELRQKKRNAYRKSKPADFFFIEHEYQKANLGFEQWKLELTAVLS